jgi:Cofactor assembly of complex C subunit B
MDSPTLVLPSTLLLTLLMVVGLFFFVKASVKDRIEKAQFISEQSEESTVTTLKQYLSQRAYRPTSLDPDQNQVTFEGMVSPSLFLAVFLTLLVMAGLFCLGLVLSLLLPQVGLKFLGLVILAPLAPVFYWRKSERIEKVTLKVEELDQQNAASIKPDGKSLVTVIGHRDELATLQATLKLTKAEIN